MGVSFIVVYGVSFFVVKCDGKKENKKINWYFIERKLLWLKKARLVVVVNQGNNTFLPLILMMFFFNYINSPKPSSPFLLSSFNFNWHLSWSLFGMNIKTSSSSGCCSDSPNLHFLHDAGCLADEGEVAAANKKK